MGILYRSTAKSALRATLLLLSMTLQTTVAIAAPQPASANTKHHPATAIHITSDQPLAATNTLGQPTRKLTLNHDGRQFSVLLAPSDVVVGLQVLNNTGKGIVPQAKYYQGRVEGQPNSWVRLAVHGKKLDGVFSLNDVRYRLLTTHGVTTLHRLAAGPNNLSLHNHRITAGKVTQSRLTSHADNLHRLPMAIIVDSQYNARTGGRGLEKALAIINAVDGIYTDEFGFGLMLNTALVYTNSKADPFDHGYVSIETMLRRLREFRIREKRLANVCLTHLFSGNANTDKPVGLAWIDTACRSDGYDVSISTPYQHDVLLAAHEIAHNLGADHDANTSCGEQQKPIMSMMISTRTRQNFSACSRKSIAKSMNRSRVQRNMVSSRSQYARNSLAAVSIPVQQLRTQTKLRKQGS